MLTAKTRTPNPHMFDPTLCHYCNKNKLDPKDKYYLPSGIEVCQQCAAKHSQSTKPHLRTSVTSQTEKKGHRGK